MDPLNGITDNFRAAKEVERQPTRTQKRQASQDKLAACQEELLEACQKVLKSEKKK
jgi:hypothetical protein